MDVKKDAITALTDARDLLASGKWVQKFYAKGTNPSAGDRVEVVDPTDSRAQCFCSVGALAKVCGVTEHRIHAHIRARGADTPLAVAGRALASVINPSLSKAIPHGVITGWNDVPGRTLPEVVEMFDEAIALLHK